MKGPVHKRMNWLARALACGVVIASAAGCDARGGAPTTAPATCPTCECNCACPDAVATPAAPVGDRGTREELEQLTFTIPRKVAKKDASCVADFARLTAIAPTTAARLGYTRGQCLLVAGRCAEGADVLRSEMAETSDVLAEQLERTVEVMVSMYCKGDLDDRGTLLRALMELQKGAYQGNIGTRACNEAIATAVRLGPRVRPKNDEDQQIVSLPQTLAPMAAGCLARAGDCAGAWRVFNARQTFASQIADPAVRSTAIRQTFDATVPKCAGQK